MSAVKVIMGLNIVCFIALVCGSSIKSLLIPSSLTLLDWGASSASETLSAHQFWRLLTSCFVHAGILHLAINMYVLRDIGREVENAYGPIRFGFVYLLSGIGGALTSIFLNPLLISAGASGAIFGSFGAMLAIVWRRPSKFPKGYLLLHGKIILCLILYSVIFSFIDKNTDNAAHFGGLLFGFFAGLTILPGATESKARVPQYIGLAALLASLIGAATAARNEFASRPDVLAETYYRKAVALLKDENYKAALPLLDATLEKTPKNHNAYCDRARAHLELKQFDQAIDDCNTVLGEAGKSLESKPSNDKAVTKSAYGIRAAIYQKLDRYSESVKDLTSMIEIDPKDSMAYNNRAWSEEALGQLKEALDDCNKSIELKNDSATTYDTRAVDYILLRDYKNALFDLEKAIKLKPKDGAFYYHRMIAKKKSGEEFDSDKQKASELGYTPESWEPN